VIGSLSHGKKLKEEKIDILEDEFLG